MSSIEFRLRRPTVDTPWGFRLQGGQDVNQPLTIQRVFNGSPADGNLQRGDVLLSINNNDVSGGYLKSAEELVRGSSNSITVVVRRTGQVVNSSQPYDDLSPQQNLHRTFESSTNSSSRYNQQSVTSSHQSQSQQHHRANVWRPNQQPQQHPTVDVHSNHSGDYQNSVTSPAGSAVSPAAAGTSGYQPVKTQWSVDSRQQQQQRPTGFGQQWSSGQYDLDQQTLPTFSHQQSVPQAGHSQNYAAKHASSSSSGTTPQSSHQGQGHGQESHFQSQPVAEDDDYEAKSVRDIKKMFNQMSKPVAFGPKQSAPKPGPWHDSHQLPQNNNVSIGGGWDKEPSKTGSSSLLPKRQQPTSTFSQSSRTSFSPPSSAAAAPSKPNPSGIYDYPPPRQEPSSTGQLNRSTMSKPVAAQTKPGAGYSYQGIVTVTPAKTVHGKNQSSGQPAGKKKEFDPSQSLVYQMLQEENERKKRGEVDVVEEEEARPRQQQQQQPPQQRRPQQAGRGGQGGSGGPQYQQPQQRSSRLQELLERDQAQSQQLEDQGGDSVYGQQQSMSAKARREMSPSYPRHHPTQDSPSIHQSPSRQRQHQHHQQPGPGAANHQSQHHHHYQQEQQQHQQHFYQQPAATQQMYTSVSSSGGYDGHGYAQDSHGYGAYDGGHHHTSGSGYDGGYNSGIPISDF